MRLPAFPAIGYYEGWELDYDTAAEGVGRAILWAAGKEPPATLSIDPDGAAVALAGPVAGQATVSVTLRRRGVQDWSLAAAPVPSPGALRFALPDALPADTYRLDAIARDAQGRVLAWATRPYEVQARRRVAAVVLEEPWSEPGGTVRGKAVLEGTEPYADERIELRVLDARRRVLLRQDLASAREAAFSFVVAPWMPQLLTVEAILLAEGRELARAYAYCRVTTRNREGWNFLIWDTPKGTLAPYAEASLAKHGVTLQLSGGNPPLHAAAHDIGWVPYTTRIQAKTDPDGIMKPFCWNDRKAVDGHLAKLAEKYTPARQHGVFVWSLGDEVDTKGCCLSPHCLDAYRQYLREQYATVAALNASWGTDFADWGAIVLSDPKDNDEGASLRAGNYPRWFDRQAFQSWNFVQFCQAYRHAYEAIDPQAKVGFEGAGRFDKGDDIDLIVRNNTFWSPYPGTVDEVIRSIAPREFPRANWMGYTKDADSLLGKFWRMVTRDMDSVWWWRWDCIGRFHGWLAPDLRPFPAVAEILEDTRIVREGLGDLLLKSSMQDDRIAILYSYPSSMAQGLENGPTYGSYERSHKGAHQSVRELGMQFRYVTDRMLRLGEFDAGRYRVLLLPRAEAMGDAEAAVVRRFVEDGGLVLADVRPAIFDGHLKPRAKGALDDLFGIVRQELPAARALKDASLGAPQADPGIALAGGTAAQVLDGVPLRIAKTTGKGRAILLNFDWSTFPNLALPDTDEAHAAWLAEIFAQAGVQAPLQIRGADGRRARHVETVRWQNDRVQILSLFREGAGETEKATVQLPAPAVVHDLRTGASLGRRTAFAATIRPNRPSWYALLPESAPKPQIVLPATARPGDVVPVRVAVPGAAGLHAFRATVRFDGRELPHFARNVLAGARPVEFVLPMALDDLPGAYDLRLEDRYTGEAATASLKLLPSPDGRVVLP